MFLRDKLHTIIDYSKEVWGGNHNQVFGTKS